MHLSNISTSPSIRIFQDNALNSVMEVIFRVSQIIVSHSKTTHAGIIFFGISVAVTSYRRRQIEKETTLGASRPQGNIPPTDYDSRGVMPKAASERSSASPLILGGAKFTMFTRSHSVPLPGTLGKEQNTPQSFPTVGSSSLHGNRPLGKRSPLPASVHSQIISTVPVEAPHNYAAERGVGAGDNQVVNTPGFKLFKPLNGSTVSSANNASNCCAAPGHLAGNDENIHLMPVAVLKKVPFSVGAFDSGHSESSLELETNQLDEPVTPEHIVTPEHAVTSLMHVKENMAIQVQASPAIMCASHVPFSAGNSKHPLEAFSFGVTCALPSFTKIKKPYRINGKRVVIRNQVSEIDHSLARIFASTIILRINSQYFNDESLRRLLATKMPLLRDIHIKSSTITRSGLHYLNQRIEQLPHLRKVVFRSKNLLQEFSKIYTPDSHEFST